MKEIMLEKQYEFSKPPFRMAPDHQFFYASEAHRTALAYLKYGLDQSEGFLVLTGEVGAGKTTLIGHLLAGLDREGLTVVKLATVNLDEVDMLRSIARSLESRIDGNGRGGLLDGIRESLEKRYREGRRVLLVVDEAQSLSVATLEELRMLMNLGGEEGRLQCFLVGQAQLSAILARSECQQVAQRVIASCHLTALSAAETYGYIMHRLEIAGWKGRPSLAPAIGDAVHRATGGIPRRINMVAGRLLLLGALERRESLGVDDVKSVVDDLEAEVVGLGQHSDGEVAELGETFSTFPVDERRLAAVEQRITDIEGVFGRIIDAMTVLLMLRNGRSQGSDRQNGDVAGGDRS